MNNLTPRVLARARVREVVIEVFFAVVVAVGMGFATVLFLG